MTTSHVEASIDVEVPAPTPVRASAPALVLRRRNEPEEVCTIGAAAASVLNTFERVIAGSKSEALLVWPRRLDGTAVFHALACLRQIAECDRRGLATLFFPWSRNTGGTQRTLLVDRSFVVKETLPALNRTLAEGDRNPAFGYLMALHSLKHMNASGKNGKRLAKALARDPALGHPSLFEIMPQQAVQNQTLQTYEDQFLWRLRRHTWIDERPAYIAAAADPKRSPFFLLGVHAEAVRVKRLRALGADPHHGGRRPDVALIDLSRQARGRLGRNWRGAIARFLAMLSDVYGNAAPPVLALTDDPFVLQALRWELLKDFDLRRGAESRETRPATTAIVLNASSDLADADAEIRSNSFELTAEVYGSDILTTVEFGLRLRRLFLDGGDEELAQSVATAIDVLQNLVGLPGPPRLLPEFLEQHYEPADRHRLGARFDHLAPRGVMQQALKNGLAGTNHHALGQFLAAYDRLCQAVAGANPGQQLFDKCVREIVRKVTRSIVVFSSELLRGFAEWRVDNDPALADIREGLGRKLLLVDRREALEELELSEREQKHFQRIVFIEPHADDFLNLLTRRWLPPKVMVLAHLARIDQALRRIHILLELDGVAPIREVLLTVQKEFERALSGRRIDVPELEFEPVLPASGVVDLTVASSPGAGPVRIIRASGGLQIRAYDGTEMALYDAEALQVFSRRLAKDLKPGDQICVFGSDFVEMAREKLKLTAKASKILALYHEAVTEAASRLPGSDTSAKTRALRDRMLDFVAESELPGLQAMRHWIDVAELANAAREEVRPQAPRNRRIYLLFMKALGISADVAQQYWDWGIFWTRSMRIRTGAAFHQVFMGVLIDPHGTVAHLPPDRRHDVWRIYETAEHHVVSVLSNEEEKPS